MPLTESHKQLIQKAKEVCGDLIVSNDEVVTLAQLLPKHWLEVKS